jgi:outer membrane receptor for ferrienterochelin and colicins
MKQPRVHPLLLYLALAPLIPASAQQDSTDATPAAVMGQLVAHGTGLPIPGASVALTGTPLATKTDSLGQFALAGVVPGVFLVEIRAVGYATASWRLTLRPGKVLTHLFEMELLPYELPEVVVKGKQPLAERRFADFERRRRAGVGYFLTQEQIERRNPATLVDLLVMVRGVKQVCLTNDCSAIMARSPPGCYPQYFLDGRESTPYFARNTPPHDIRGIEVYRGSSETPGEFIGSNSGCGVIVIWTKSAP